MISEKHRLKKIAIFLWVLVMALSLSAQTNSGWSKKSIASPSGSKASRVTKSKANTVSGKKSGRNNSHKQKQQQLLDYGVYSDRLYQAALNGDDDAQYSMGYFYMFGEGVTQNEAQAIYWLQKSASLYNEYACYALGCCYYYGNGVIKDDSKSFTYLLRAANGGVTDAMGMVGKMYLQGIGTRTDSSLAANWLKKGAEAGDDRAQHAYGLALYFGNGVYQNYVAAAQWFQKAANQGNLDSKYWLGYCYETGTGVAKNANLGVSLVREAANGGVPGAMSYMGLLYNEGVPGVITKNLYESYRWYSMAAEKGDADGMYNVALCYLKGTGVGMNQNKGQEWMRKAADAGSHEAKQYINISNYNNKSISELELLANRGDAIAMYNLGEKYYYGNDVKKDLKKALSWYLAAADLGNADAQYSAGFMYYKGEGCRKSKDNAKKYLKMAIDNGHQQAYEFWLSNL